MARNGLKVWLSLTLQELVTLGEIEVAVATEHTGKQTDALLLAASCGREWSSRVVFLIYRRPGFPDLPPNFDLESGWPRAGRSSARWDGQLEPRPVRKLTPQLTPVDILRDLFGIEDLEPISPAAAFRLHKESGQLHEIPQVRLLLSSDHRSADHLRMCGRRFLRRVFTPQTGAVQAAPVGLPGRRAVGSARAPGGLADDTPVVHYARDAANKIVAIELAAADPGQPCFFDPCESLTRTFLGPCRLSNPVTLWLSSNRPLFHADPARGYSHAIARVVRTSLLRDAMVAEHREIYQGLGFEPDRIPPMKNSPDSRAAQLLEQLALRHAAGSEVLADLLALQALMRQGNPAEVGVACGPGRPGGPTGSHDDVLIGGSGRRLWREAPGRDHLRELDLRECSNGVAEDKLLCCGRPAIYEPGDAVRSLLQMVHELQKIARHGTWFILVGDATGADHDGPIPRTAAANSATRSEWPPAAGSGPAAPRPAAATIPSRIVTADTWELIQALPAALRRAYEGLSAKVGVFYPSALIAADGLQYDSLRRQLGASRTGRRTWLDVARRRLVTVEEWSPDNVTLAVPLRDASRLIAGTRGETSDAGPSRGGEQVRGLFGGSLLRALANPDHAIGNVVAANVITAAAGAAAWSILQTLNGYHVFGEHCSYRRDQIPALPLAGCLKMQPDYPARRAEAGGPIPFVPADEVPLDDGEFQDWLRARVRWFLGQAATSPVDRCRFEHREPQQRTTLDAPACDQVGTDIEYARSSR